MFKFPSMPETTIEAAEGEIVITQKQEHVGEVTVWFPAQMVDTVIAAMRAAAAESLSLAPQETEKGNG